MPAVDLSLPLWPRQRQAFDTDATELLFGGATRGGKSHLIRVALIVWCLSIPNLQCLMIRKKFQDILDNHVYGPNGFQDLLAPLIALGAVEVTQTAVIFKKNKSRIAFKHCQDERQFESAQGIPSHVLVVDEATQISERLLRTFRAWCTMTEEMKERLPAWAQGRFPRIIYTANPIGASVGYFRRHFVKARPQYAIEAVDGFLRQFIPSRVEDNPSENLAATIGRVKGMHDAATAQALLEGDWDAPIGEFYPEWDELRHVVPDFEPPRHWFRYRTFDWGSAEPFACYWWAFSDGEMFRATVRLPDENGILVAQEKSLWFPRGARICYREWYGCDPAEPSVGYRDENGHALRNADIALGIVAKSSFEGEKHLKTLTDSYVFPDRGETAGQTIAKTFEDNGVLLELGDTRRITGWKQLRDLLVGKQMDLNSTVRTPMIYITEGCKYLRDYIPMLSRHPTILEDAADKGEATHSCDCARLAAMAFETVTEASPPSIEEYTKAIAASISSEMTFNQAVEYAKRVKSGGNRGRW